MSNNPLFIQDPALSYDAQDFRRLLATLVGEGVADVGGGQLRVTQRAQGANMSVDVAAGLAFIQGDTVAGQGNYQATFDATNLAIAAAPASNSRVDLVIARVSDKQVVGSATSGRSIEILTGIAAATPVVPALPETAITLAKVTVSAGSSSVTTGNITDLRSPVSSGSGAVGTSTRTLTTAQIAAVTGSRVGELVTNTDIGRVLFWNGTAWRPVGGGASGSVVVGSVAVPASAGSPLALAYFIGLGFDEVTFALAINATGTTPYGGVFTATADPATSFGTAYAYAAGGSYAYSWAPSSVTSTAYLTLVDPSGQAQNAIIRNLRLGADGYLRFELLSQSNAFTTATTTRFNWRAR